MAPSTSPYNPAVTTASPLTPPPAPPSRRSRLVLPAYRHVPGLTPHPVTHPEGHSYGVREAPVELGERRLPRDWRRLEEYLHGVDLFNRAYLWESHEAWEGVWHAVRDDRLVADYLQGLIQAAAALLQHHLGHRRGARNLLRKSDANLAAARRWTQERSERRFMGVDLVAWWDELERHLDGGGPYPYLRLED